MIAVGVVAWLLAALALVLIVGRAVRIADEARVSPAPTPTRLDPRAGKNAARAGRTTFTTVLALAVLVGVGVAQDVFGAAGGVQ